MPDRLYHNPRCSKSREALALLRARGVEPQLVLYLETPPDAATIEALLAKLDAEPTALLREGEPEYAALGLGRRPLDAQAVAAAIAALPRLLQRPVFERDGRAVVGRPPERVLDLLGAGARRR